MHTDGERFYLHMHNTCSVQLYSVPALRQVIEELNWQVFVYLNRNAILWDTISSPDGYHQIDKSKEYPVHQYYFNSLSAVERYWYELWNICMNTLLGGRMCMSGKVVEVEPTNNKPEMMEAMEPRTVEEAAVRDVGYLPGDHLGAAGFDSTMFASVLSSVSLLRLT
ncbi:General transcription factor 3C polypeptide 1 [Homalodisca vitripennis]|nr:General transcription factor 3C polypeptide 1 [Homalodisca vitripennis]